MDVLRKVSPRHFVFSIPKILPRYFLELSALNLVFNPHGHIFYTGYQAH